MLTNLDLKLLQLLNEIFRNGSLTRAAERLTLSQPAVSLALAKLRRHFDDPLFVRTGRGLAPTPLTLALMPRVRLAIDALQSTIGFKLDFSPLDSNRVFRLSITDIGQITLLPQLLAALRDHAPHVRVQISTVSDSSPHELAQGELDLAVGFMPKIGSDFYQQVVLEERFICLARAEHPRVKHRLTVAGFQRELHAIVTTSGTGQYVVDKAITDHNLTRQVGVHIPNFIGLAEVIEATDLLCTVPRRAGLIMARGAGVKVFEPPFNIPAYHVRQYWHERYNHDPGHQWLRSLIAGLF